MKRLDERNSLRPVRAAVGVLALTVLGPLAAESQILIICGLFHNSYADTGNNLCHGAGSGCIECVFIPLATFEDGEPVDTPSQSVTMASHSRLFDGPGELGQPLSLAEHTGLAFAPSRESVCDAPPLFDRLRVAGKAHLAPAVRDRSRKRETPRVTAR